MTGSELRLARLRARVKQTSVAALLGVTTAAVCQLEKRPRPRPATIEKYLQAILDLKDGAK